MQHNVYLQGELGERFGHKFSVYADSCSDIFKCINANKPDFRGYLIECAEKDIGFNITHQEKDLLEDDLLMPLKEGDITLSIVPAGSKGGGDKLGAAVLIGALMWWNPMGWAMTAKTATAAAKFTIWGNLAFGLAVNLALAGLQQVMAPDPSTDEQKTEDKDYLFNGTVAVTHKGDPVPILYGELRVPGRSIALDVINGVYLNPTSIIEADNALSVHNTTYMEKTPE